MEVPDLKEIAKMLGKPEGEFGLRVAENMNKSNEHIIQLALDAILLQKRDYVLEIGFGNGAHIQGLLSRAENIKYFGLDISETMVVTASENYSEEIKSGSVNFHLGSSSEMPYASNSFDKIFTVNTLYFWKEPEIHLLEILRVLKPGGIFCLAIKSRSFMKNLPFVKYGFILYEKEEAAALIQTNGFKIKNVDYKVAPVEEIMGMSLAQDAILIAASKE